MNSRASLVFLAIDTAEIHSESAASEFNATDSH